MTQQSQQPMGSTGQQTYGGSGGSTGTSRGVSGQQVGGQQGGQQVGSQQGGQQVGGQQGGQQVGSQQFGGQQTGQSHQSTHQQVGQRFESELTPELSRALEAFDRVVEIASWCADKCIESGQEMAECARLCLDLAEIAELNEKLIARDSINGPEVAETFLRVAQQGKPVLQQYQQSYHVSETLQAVEQAIETTNKLLSSIGGQQGFQEMQGRQGGQMGGQQGGQMGGQQGGQMGGQQGGRMGQQGAQIGQQSGGQTSQQPPGQQFPQSY